MILDNESYYNQGYKRGKLYRVSAYNFETFDVWTKERTRQEGGREHRNLIATLPTFESIFLYLGYVFDHGDPRGPRGYYHVITGDVAGLIDTRIVLKELERK